MSAAHRLLCALIGHSYARLDPHRGIAGALRCRCCGKFLPALQWPTFLEGPK